MSEDFRIEFISDIDDIDCDNIDVVVTLSNGDKYAATFFTISNIKRILKRYRDSGECAFGKYFLVIIYDYNRECKSTHNKRSYYGFIENRRI